MLIPLEKPVSHLKGLAEDCWSRLRPPLVEVPVPDTSGDTLRALRFYCPTKLARRRAKRLLEREPQTVDWIKQMDIGATFWDIGANVGSYSILAAIWRGAHVLSFEPHYANFYTLTKNLELNSLTETVGAFCIALTDRTRIDRLNIPQSCEGASGSSFSRAEDYLGRSFTPQVRLAVIGMTVDGFRETFRLDPPHYIKLDVDGVEEDILLGAPETLRHPALKSVSVEIEESRPIVAANIRRALEEAGLAFDRKEAAIPGRPTTTFNYVFTRATTSGAS
jgi:FkbM family methyltransferase